MLGFFISLEFTARAVVNAVFAIIIMYLDLFLLLLLEKMRFGVAAELAHFGFIVSAFSFSVFPV